MKIVYAGLGKTTANVANPTQEGFINQTGLGRIPYTGGTLTYPVATPADGVFTASASAGGVPVTVTFPLGPGFARPGFVSVGPAGTSFTYGSGPGQVSGTIVGTSYMSPNSTFSYINASLVPSDPTIPTQRAFFFGGQAVPANSQLLTQPPGTAKLYTFTLQQDAALQSPIPFITQTTGGNIPEPDVSPYYVVAPRNRRSARTTQTQADRDGTQTLQASLGIAGQGALRLRLWPSRPAASSPRTAAIRSPGAA